MSEALTIQYLLRVSLTIHYTSYVQRDREEESSFRYWLSRNPKGNEKDDKAKLQHKIDHKWTKSSALIFKLEVRCKTIKGWSHADF